MDRIDQLERAFDARYAKEQAKLKDLENRVQRKWREVAEISGQPGNKGPQQIGEAVRASEDAVRAEGEKAGQRRKVDVVKQRRQRVRDLKRRLVAPSVNKSKGLLGRQGDKEKVVNGVRAIRDAVRTGDIKEGAVVVGKYAGAEATSAAINKVCEKVADKMPKFRAPTKLGCQVLLGGGADAETLMQASFDAVAPILSLAFESERIGNESLPLHPKYQEKLEQQLGRKLPAGTERDTTTGDLILPDGTVIPVRKPKR